MATALQPIISVSVSGSLSLLALVLHIAFEWHSWLKPSLDDRAPCAGVCGTDTRLRACGACQYLLSWAGIGQKLLSQPWIADTLP